MSEISRWEIMSILETCGTPEQTSANCIVNQLNNTNLKISEPNIATQMIADYNDILMLDTQNERCMNNQLAEANYAIGNCYFVMNFYILEKFDQEYTKQRLIQCLMSELGGIAQRGNNVALVRMDKVSRQLAGSYASGLWFDSLKNKLSEEEFNLMIGCYN